mmetsp:Transcript_7823/g.26173  ORF Transcript_7823/g.26173 Transcript_7823/m.26173 type:complete len:226 (+) Transcript_7823:289-966(+)
MRHAHPRGVDLRPHGVPGDVRGGGALRVGGAARQLRPEGSLHPLPLRMALQRPVPHRALLGILHPRQEGHHGVRGRAAPRQPAPCRVHLPVGHPSRHNHASLGGSDGIRAAEPAGATRPGGDFHHVQRRDHIRGGCLVSRLQLPRDDNLCDQPLRLRLLRLYGGERAEPGEQGVHAQARQGGLCQGGRDQEGADPGGHGAAASAAPAPARRGRSQAELCRRHAAR